MEKPNIITIDNDEFYLADDLREFDNTYFVGCAKTVRLIVNKKDIPSSAYKYLTKKKTSYEYSTEDYKKAKLALTRKWVEENIPSMSNGLVKDDFDKEPNKIILSKQEMLDLDGNEMNLVIVGEREYNKCYFRVKNVSEYFESPNLKDTVLDKKQGGYVENKHYKYFIGQNTGKSCKKTIKKVLYLTYTGLIRFLFTSRNKKAEVFQDWAAKILFTHQVGTTDQKQKLVKSLMGIDACYAIESLNTSVTKIACVYLLVIDTVKELRVKMKIPDKYDDNDYVCKYGESDNLSRRISEHKKTFEDYTDNIKLNHFSIIDESNRTKAETHLRSYFNDIGVHCELIGQKELVVLNKQQLKNISKLYEDAGIIYGASFRDYKTMTDKKMMEHQHQYEMETSKLKSDIELLKKDLQIMMRDKELLEMKNKKLKDKLNRSMT